MTRPRGNQRGQVVVEAAGLLPIAAIAALLMVDCGVVLADRLAVTRVASDLATGRHLADPDSLEREGKQLAPARLTKSLHARTVKKQLVVSARPHTLVLGRVSNLSVSSSVDLPDSPEVQAS